MRINEVARHIGVDNKVIIDYLETIGVYHKSHSSSIDQELIDMVNSHFKKGEPEEEAPPKKGRFKRIRRPKDWSPDDPTQEEPVAASEEATPDSPAEAPEPGAISLHRPPRIEPPVIDPATGLPETAEQKAKRKKDRIAAKKAAKAQKKAKHQTIMLEPRAGAAKPEVIIDAEGITPADDVDPKKPIIDVDVKEKEVEVRVKHNQDDAIRREIQKLKAKQQRVEQPEDKTKNLPVRSTRRPGTQPRGKSKKAWKREKRRRFEEQVEAEIQQEQREMTVLKIHDATTVADVANGLDVPVSELIQKLIGLGVMASVNQPIDEETIQVIADDYNFEVERVDLFDSDLFTQMWQEDTDETRLVERPPVVTIMGHVDHGKTKLLDALRSSDIVATEAGGITQHIGAYYVKTDKGDLAILDTPGHAAFTAMRARGAMVTDIVILVVAATDGVMPQTKEAIHHAKAAGVPIIVAINKVDLENANIDKVKQGLSDQGLVCEEWGGDTVMVPISALKKTGLESLMEAVLLHAELLELKADPECRARGTIVEGRLEPGRGPVATVLVQQGKLRIGEPFVTGVYSGRVRAMSNEHGHVLEEAGPSTPVEILGMQDVPSAGDPFIAVADDSQAKQISARLQQIQRERDMRRANNVTLEDLHMHIESGVMKELRMIVKGDVQGSVGAICESLHKIESDKIRINILHSGVGSITESDVMLASASNALIIGFNVRPNLQVTELSKREHVDIRTYRIIYDAIEEIRKAMTGMLDKTFEEDIIGRGEIREVFRLSKGMSIAGSYVQNGKLVRNSKVRLLRDDVVIHDGQLSSLRRFKDDVREVASGYECGLGFERYSDLREGDVVECYALREVAPTL